MTKLVRALWRTIIVAASLFGILTIVEIQRKTSTSQCPGCTQKSFEFWKQEPPSHEEFFQRASHYRIVEAEPSSGTGKAEKLIVISEEKNSNNTETVDELTLRFEERKREINRICTNESSSVVRSVPINHWEFLINHRYKLMWCSIFKSASSTWFDYFMTIAGVDPHVKKNSDVELARKTAYPRPSLDDLLFFLNDPSYVSFVIVREPFERILSSYQDKIVNTKLKFYQDARCRMAKEKRSSRKCKPNFSQFVDFILQENAAGKHLDEHWVPYSLFCSLCRVNYTYVLKFENLQEEQNYLISHVPGLEKYPPMHEHSSQRDYTTLVREHYSQLSREQLDGLVSLYRDDFLISGHSWLKYYDYIQNGTNRFVT